jgi:hypothetical protein
MKRNLCTAFCAFSQCDTVERRAQPNEGRRVREDETVVGFGAR